MVSKKFPLIIIGCLLLILPALLLAQEEAKKEEAKYDYIGAKKCGICHKKDGIYESWEKTPHPNATANLPEDQQKNDKCLACHATAVMADGEVLEGVQCEGCHGPGSGYKSMSIMKNKEEAIKNGLIMPTAETCQGCHNKEKMPADIAAHKEAPAFDFAKMKAKGVHAMPEASEK